MFHLIAQLRSFIKDEQGAAMVEYAVIMALVIAIGAAVFNGIGVDLAAIFTAVDGVVNGVATAPLGVN